MVWEREKTVNDVGAPVLTLIEALVEFDLSMKRLLLVLGAPTFNSFYHNVWTDMVDKSHASSADTIILLQGSGKDVPWLITGGVTAERL